MKTVESYKTVLVATALILIVALPGKVFALSQVRFISFSYLPYYSETYLENKQGNGVVIDIVRAAFKTQGISTEITFQPILRSGITFKKGQHVGYIGSLLAFSSHVGESEVSTDLICKYRYQMNYFKSNLKREVVWNEFSDLSQYKIADILGSVTAAPLKEAGATVTQSKTLDAALQKTVMGRTDLWPAIDLTAYYMVEANHPERLDDLISAQKPIFNGTVDIYFLKRHQDFDEAREAYYMGITEIKQNGTLDEIITRYFGKNQDALKIARTSCLSE